MKILATILAVGALVGSAFASSPTAPDAGNKWNINVGFAVPDGDLKDAGVDNMFSFGADWILNSGMGDTGDTSSYLGILAMFGSGDADVDVMTYGIHYGFEFGLGDNNEFAVRLQGGYYNSKVDLGSGELDEWGFGGMGALGYKPASGGFSIWVGYYFFPEVDGADNRGFQVTVGIPVK
jgi:hypothetical protein